MGIIPHAACASDNKGGHSSYEGITPQSSENEAVKANESGVTIVFDI